MRYADAVTARKVPATLEISLASLIAWLERQPPDQEYPWSCPQDCLLGQWLAAMGMPRQLIYSHSSDIGSTQPFKSIILRGEMTFGAALYRARKLALAGEPE